MTVVMQGGAAAATTMATTVDMRGGDEGMAAALHHAVATADAVSFDFFDTLFYRIVDSPDDVFDIIGRRFDLPDFRAQRKAAQAEAFARMHKAGRNEISLTGIYECLPLDQALVRSLQAAEYALELDVIRPDPTVLGALHHALNLGKPVVITSDMYLTEPFFKDALERYGVPSVPLFISSACDATKRDFGDLFDLVADYLQVPRARLLHIGDNPHGDIAQANAKGLATFLYRRETVTSPVAPKPCDEVPVDPRELGYNLGGRCAVAFLDWMERQVREDGIDHVLFLARDGYVMDRIVRENLGAWDLPRCSYFGGSRTAFTLAAINDQNFPTYLPYLLSGSDGLSPYEVLERIGVPAPAAEVMKQYGLGDDVMLSPALHARMHAFLHEYRFEIMAVCRRNRRGLFNYLKELKLQRGTRVALVDVGWHGTTQEAFETAVRPMVDVSVQGYYFCLADSPDTARRRRRHAMRGLFSTDSVADSVVRRLYDNRVLIELFFTAPHNSIIGLEPGSAGVRWLEDGRFDPKGELSAAAAAVAEGMQAYARDQVAARASGSAATTDKTLPLETAWPLVDLLGRPGKPVAGAVAALKNFDSWGATRNKDMLLKDALG
ncbi:HAD family hydrolase [Nitrospirillum amazonense]|uniref:Putative HAD superfamily hydrolase n=1 Tax=Nitrospirillum amazonense TaxID=28077 RepID=A0A560JCI7_9PROT|nr:HAD hydrolase-like protein [Nitrospirillum amazonense]MDG3439881.1 HAD hydrolase-like protein [Nitrospirillum amazonense]TWB68697.1 putative HAD superfamily hydrolase [Nitrospirillum amazonense]